MKEKNEIFFPGCGGKLVVEKNFKGDGLPAL